MKKSNSLYWVKVEGGSFAESGGNKRNVYTALYMLLISLMFSSPVIAAMICRSDGEV